MNYTKSKLSKFKMNAATNTMTSGMIAGLIATAATHPFEIARAHLQIACATVK